MPSSEDIIQAQNEVRQLAEKQLIEEGHPPQSAKEIVSRMSQDEQIEKAEKQLGYKIYRGAYGCF